MINYHIRSRSRKKKRRSESPRTGQGGRRSTINSRYAYWSIDLCVLPVR